MLEKWKIKQKFHFVINKKSTYRSALSKNGVIYLTLVITNKKKLEFAYCYISCRKFITAGTSVNTLSEIVAALVGYPFVALAGHLVVALAGYPFVALVGHPFVDSLDQLVFEPVQ